MGGTWSGTFSNELVTATPYQAVNGVRAVIDMGTLGDCTVIAPEGLDQASFSVWFTNPNRNTLTITVPEPLTTIQSGEDAHKDAASIDVNLLDGVASFTHIDGDWDIDSASVLAIPVGLRVGVTWEPRGTNGLCVVVDQQNVVTVERTAEGVYLMTTDGTSIDGKIIMPSLNTIGHAANMHPTFTITNRSATTVELTIGKRNPGGIFNSDDLTDDTSNTVSLIVASIP